MSHTQLTLKERFKIETLLEAGWTQKDIADHIGRNPGTVSREISRNGGDGYEPQKASSLCIKRRRLGKRKSKKLLMEKTIREYVEEKLNMYWSPEQISGRIRKD